MASRSRSKTPTAPTGVGVGGESKTTATTNSNSSTSTSTTSNSTNSGAPLSTSSSSSSSAPATAPFNLKLFKKCKSATFQIDGATYTIVASSPENAKTKDDSFVLSEQVCSSQPDCAGSSAANSPTTAAHTSTSSADVQVESPGPQNGQESKHGSLTIVRRSNSRKDNLLQQHQQHQHPYQHQPLAQTPGGAGGGGGGPDSPLVETCTIENFQFNEPFDVMHPSTAATAASAATAAASTNRNQSQMRSPATASASESTAISTATAGGGGGGGGGALPPADGAALVDLTTDNLPAVDTPDACDKAALRLRCLLRQLQCGEISAETLQRNLHYAARVLEAVFIDESNHQRQQSQQHHHNHQHHPSQPGVPRKEVAVAPSAHGGPTGPPATDRATLQRRRLRTPVWASQDVANVQAKSSDKSGPPAASSSNELKVKRRLADEDDELSEVQPDAVPPEVREWLASTFTRQLATTRKKSDEKPKFRSVAHAIRAGIFVDRIYRRVSSTALMQFPPDVVRVLKTLDDWSFDVFALSDAANGQPVKYLGYDLLNRYGIIHKFKVPPATLEIFLTRIEEGYCKFKNPYHNNLHAADVAQTVHYCLCQIGMMHWMSDLEIFATLLAALIHDFEHTGTTNNFHVMSGSDKAMLYNDRAVLENHHISAAFRVINEDDCNVLSNLSKEEYRELRTLVIDMVLATDMSYHFQQLKNMKNLLTLAEPAVDKSKALALVLHCCDIAHPAKKWEVHHRWTMLLLEEFFRQGDLELELGLPYSPLCDRNNTLVAESQIGFIEFIVEPSMAACADMLESILAPIAPIAKPSTVVEEDGGGGAGGKEGTTAKAPAVGTISEEGEGQSKNGTTTAEKPARFQIKKPWIECLAANKKIWKEQAIKDAEARAAAAAEAEAAAQEETAEADAMDDQQVD